jgi:hypothetical protein
MSASLQGSDLGSNSAILRTKIAITSENLSTALTELWQHPDLGDRFPRFLVLLHQIMRASVPVMAEARRVAMEGLEDDPTAPLLAAYLTDHIEEEVNHDIWTVDDLESAGFDCSALLEQISLPDVAGMIGAQYYWIRHHHPLAVLGYLAILEGRPPNPTHIDRIQRETGLHQDIFRTYRMHGDFDPHHREELWALIDRLPLSPGQTSLMSISAFHTSHMFATCINNLDLVAPPPRRSLKATTDALS